MSISVQKAPAAVEILKPDTGVFNGGDRHRFGCVRSVSVGVVQVVGVEKYYVPPLSSSRDLCA